MSGGSANSGVTGILRASRLKKYWRTLAKSQAAKDEGSVSEKKGRKGWLATARGLAVGKVRAAGLSLLERTEAIIDSLLASENSGEGCNDDCSCPAPPPIESLLEPLTHCLTLHAALQYSAARFFRSAKTWATVVVVQETCTAMVQRLGIDHIRQFLVPLEGRASELGDISAGKDVGCFRFVVKNSFIEAIEDDEHVSMPRSRSFNAFDRLASRVDISERFRLELGSLHSGSRTAALEAGVARMETGPTPVPIGTISETGTTVILRSLPLDFSRADLLRALDAVGFAGRYNFVYVPADFARGRGLGYALVSFLSQENAEKLLEFREWPLQHSAKTARACWEAAWSEPQLHLIDLVERYRNSPVMHPRVADEFKPVLYLDGKPVAFPPPTRPLRHPRIRHGKTPTPALLPNLQ